MVLSSLPSSVPIFSFGQQYPMALTSWCHSPLHLEIPLGHNTFERIPVRPPPPCSQMLPPPFKLSNPPHTSSVVPWGFRCYRLHSFLSGNVNNRTDQYGGSLENRLRYPLEVIKAIRDARPVEKPFWVRSSSSDFKNDGTFSKDDHGWDIYQSIEYAKELKKLGVDVIDCSSGGILSDVKNRKPAAGTLAKSSHSG
ncbi:hypothetical protein BCR42DRAFT_457101 [Absidia repens]|uniref:NADH:flavin oxidoreductase/NADH oxidase N-terminal domain-containing protein n=1 Tax=Absidia repens TaxID=90262 RepID=A0A1X2HXS5_9FUNG|nr:hypothetical protein BCR42DRAFT_457101 [Absidia repens]